MTNANSTLTYYSRTGPPLSKYTVTKGDVPCLLCTWRFRFALFTACFLQLWMLLNRWMHHTPIAIYDSVYMVLAQATHPARPIQICESLLDQDMMATTEIPSPFGIIYTLWCRKLATTQWPINTQPVVLYSFCWISMSTSTHWLPKSHLHIYMKSSVCASAALIPIQTRMMIIHKCIPVLLHCGITTLWAKLCRKQR